MRLSRVLEDSFEGSEGVKIARSRLVNREKLRTRRMKKRATTRRVRQIRADQIRSRSGEVKGNQKARFRGRSGPDSDYIGVKFSEEEISVLLILKRSRTDTWGCFREFLLGIKILGRKKEHPQGFSTVEWLVKTFSV